MAAWRMKSARSLSLSDIAKAFVSFQEGLATLAVQGKRHGIVLRAPHGGIWVTPLIGSPLLYLLAIAIGTVITAAAVIALKAAGPGPVKTELDEAGLAEVVVA